MNIADLREIDRKHHAVAVNLLCKFFPDGDCALYSWTIINDDILMLVEKFDKENAKSDLFWVWRKISDV